MKKPLNPGAKTRAHIERLMYVCGIQECDRSEPYVQEFNGKIYVDCRLYELNARTYEKLYNLIALTAQEIYSYTSMSTNKYRACTRIEIAYH